MKNRRGVPLITIGLLLIAAALLLTGYNLQDEERATQAVETTAAQLEERIPPAPEPEAAERAADPGKENPAPEIPDYILNPEMDMPEEIIDGHSYIGLLEIPACGLTLPVLSEWSYPDLKLAPCRYMGSVYTGDLILAGHNYRSHFGSLRYLNAGDRVVFTDVDGNVFVYEVALVETLASTAVEEMETGDWDLTLFTCTLSRTYRVTVRCQRVEN